MWKWFITILVKGLHFRASCHIFPTASQLITFGGPWPILLLNQGLVFAAVVDEMLNHIRIRRCWSSFQHTDNARKRLAVCSSSLIGTILHSIESAASLDYRPVRLAGHWVGSNKVLRSMTVAKHLNEKCKRYQTQIFTEDSKGACFNQHRFHCSPL